MYVPPAFREERREVLQDLIRQHSFGTLVSHLDGELFATHLPFLLDAGRGEHGTLLGHLARANPHWHAFHDGASGPESLVMFQGPHAYVSPSWYEAEVAVPTWNYVAVHAYGRPRIVHDPSAVQRILRQTVDTYESGFERPWSMDGLPQEYVGKMAQGIVAFEIPISRLEGKRKLNQNRSQADRRGVQAALRRQGDRDGPAIADLMTSLEP